jgi:hypothetical protein
VAVLGFESHDSLIGGHPQVGPADRDACLLEEGDLVVGELAVVVGEVLAFQPGRFSAAGGQVTWAAMAGDRFGELVVAVHPPGLGRVPGEPDLIQQGGARGGECPGAGGVSLGALPFVELDAAGGQVSHGDLEVPVGVFERG